MRVCPKCGYLDPNYWQPSRARRRIDVARLEDFEKDFPILADELCSMKPIQHGNYAYRMTKSKVWIERQCIIDNPDWQRQWNLDYEYSKRSIGWHPFGKAKMKNQRRLDEIMMEKTQ